MVAQRLACLFVGMASRGNFKPWMATHCHKQKTAVRVCQQQMISSFMEEDATKACKGHIKNAGKHLVSSTFLTQILYFTQLSYLGHRFNISFLQNQHKNIRSI